MTVLSGVKRACGPVYWAVFRPQGESALWHGFCSYAISEMCLDMVAENNGNRMEVLRKEVVLLWHWFLYTEQTEAEAV